MNSTLIESPPHAADGTTLPGVIDADRANPGLASSPWRWTILACLLLGISGGVRAWRDHQFAQLSSRNKECPFPLSDIPKSLGDWHAIDDSESRLDPEIARIAGSSDHLIRSYADSKTGEKVTVLLLYGLAEGVFGHTPEVCYPATGHQAATRPKDLDIAVPGNPRPATFRSQIFFQPQGPAGGHYAEVFYSFRHANHWQPEMAGEWKKFRADPGMFKIQTTREVSAAAASPEGPEPKVSKSIVTELVKAIEQKIASATPPEGPRG